MADYREGVLVGYRWYDVNGTEPLFPFGYGLSYTRFAYRDLAVAAHADGWEVAFTVRNMVRASAPRWRNSTLAHPTG